MVKMEHFGIIPSCMDRCDSGRDFFQNDVAPINSNWTKKPIVIGVANRPINRSIHGDISRCEII